MLILHCRTDSTESHVELTLGFTLARCCIHPFTAYVHQAFTLLVLAFHCRFECCLKTLALGWVSSSFTRSGHRLPAPILLVKSLCIHSARLSTIGMLPSQTLRDNDRYGHFSSCRYLVHVRTPIFQLHEFRSGRMLYPAHSVLLHASHDRLSLDCFCHNLSWPLTYFRNGWLIV
jgi:hypothetical protein